jgi:hypothetical protein
VGIGAKIHLYTTGIFVRNVTEGENAPRRAPRRIMSLLLVLAKLVREPPHPKFGSSIPLCMACTFVNLATYKRSNQNSQILWINPALLV